MQILVTSSAVSSVRRVDRQSCETRPLQIRYRSDRLSAIGARPRITRTRSVGILPSRLMTREGHDRICWLGKEADVQWLTAPVFQNSCRLVRIRPETEFAP